MEKKESFKLYQEIGNKISWLEKEGKIKTKEGFIRYELGLFGELSLALGIYNYPSVAYFYIEKIIRSVEEKKCLFFGKTIMKDSFDGRKVDLDRLLKPLGEKIIQPDYLDFSDFKKGDLLYKYYEEPYNLVVIRIPNSFDEQGFDDNYLDFLIDVKGGLYYNSLKKKYDQHEK